MDPFYSGLIAQVSYTLDIKDNREYLTLNSKGELLEFVYYYDIIRKTKTKDPSHINWIDYDSQDRVPLLYITLNYNPIPWYSMRVDVVGKILGPLGDYVLINYR